MGFLRLVTGSMRYSSVYDRARKQNQNVQQDLAAVAGFVPVFLVNPKP